MADDDKAKNLFATVSAVRQPGTPSVERFERRWSEALEPGALLAQRYLLRRYIAAGGMGEVWEADDLTLGEAVALKTIRPDRVSEETRHRFQAEVKLARRVSHRHLCRIFEFGQHRAADGTEVDFLTMELLRGPSLVDVLRERGPLPVEEALVVLGQLAAALDAAHAAGVVHRDFKSPNIFLEATAAGVRAVITDFGLALDVALETRITADTRLTMGTPAYMAPEQVEGADVGPPADLYALGVVAFELVTGQTPFRGTSAIAVATARLSSLPIRASTLGAPAHWDAVLAVALARKPEARFERAAEMVAALEDPARLARPRVRVALVAVALACLAGFAAAAAYQRRHAWVEPCPEGVCPPWSGHLVGTEDQDMVEAVLIRPTGEVLIGGSISGSADLSCGPFQIPESRKRTGLIAQFSRAGLCQWNWVGSATTTVDFVQRLFQGPSGKVFAWGANVSVPKGPWVGTSVILELDASGQAREVPTQGAPPAWETVVVDREDRVVIAAVKEGHARTHASPTGLELLRLLPSGEREWQVSVAQGAYLTGKWIETDLRGDIGLIGTFRGTVKLGDTSFASKGETDMFMLKASGVDGHLLWATTFGSPADESQDLGLVSDAEGNWFAVGEHGGMDMGQGPLPASIFVVKWSPSGAVRWSKGFGGASRRDAARRVVLDAAGDPIVFGRFVSGQVEVDGQRIANVGGSDLYLARLSSRSGELLGLKTYPAVDAPARGLAVDRSTGNVAIAGRFDQVLSFGQGRFQALGQDGYWASLGVVP